MKKHLNLIIGICIVIVALLIDQLTKLLISSTMSVGQSIQVIQGFFYITYVRNDGAGFGILGGQTLFLVITSILALGVFAFLFKDINFKTKKLYSISLSIMIAGTIGNMIDRILYQEVVDFFQFFPFGYAFAVFNVADICLTIGITLFAFVILVLDSIKKENHNEQDSPSE